MGNGSSSRCTPITDEFYILPSGNLALFTFVINRVKEFFTDIAKYFTAFTTVVSSFHYFTYLASNIYIYIIYMYIYHNFVITQNCNATKQNELLQKKKSKQRWGEKLKIYFSESAPLPWIFIFVTLPLQILEKTSFHPGNSAKICDIPSNFECQKPRPMEIPH